MLIPQDMSYLMCDHVLPILLQGKPTLGRSVEPPLCIQMDMSSLEFSTGQRRIASQAGKGGHRRQMDDEVWACRYTREGYAPRDPSIGICEVNVHLLGKLPWRIRDASVYHSGVPHYPLVRK